MRILRPLHIRCFLRMVPGMLKIMPSNRWACLAGAEGRAGFRVHEAARIAERDRFATQRKSAGNQMRLRANLGALQPTDAPRNRLIRLLNTDATRHSPPVAALPMAGATVARAASCPDGCHCRVAAVGHFTHVR